MMPRMGGRGRSALVRASEAVLAAVSAVPWVRSRIARRALEAQRRSGLAVFVCHGNLNRSAVAVALARARWPHRTVAEAGCRAVAGTPSAGEAIDAARRWNVDLAQHRATALSPEVVAASTTVFVFDVRNALCVIGRHPSALARVHLLGALLPEGPLTIPDPQGHGREAYVDAFGRIARAIRTLEPGPPRVISDARRLPGR